MHMAEITNQSTFAERLVDALNRDRFVLYRQVIEPIAPFSDDCVFQEILVRHIEEEEQLFHPGAFFPILETHNLMYMLDRWVINRVIRWFLAKYTVQHGWSAVRCSVNLSGDAISRASFAGFVKAQLQTSRLPPDKLSFEITEADAEAHAVALEHLIAELQPLGCTFVLTGYEGVRVSAELLQAFGINYVKINGGIIRNIHESSASVARAESIHEVCRSLKIRTIGEFVERAETLEVLKRIGINFAQGYSVAMPEPLA